MTTQVCRNRIVRDLPSSTYHGTPNTWSSSQLKKILEDVEVFKRKYIDKTEPKEHISAFDVGTYFHTAILEPHKLDEECAVWAGRRSGNEWKAFAELHKDKAILTETERAKIAETIAVVKESAECNKYLKGYEAEVSAFVDIYVMDEEVYTISNSNEVYILNLDGWELSEVDPDMLKEFGVVFETKSRSDAIHIVDRVISDLKTTSGNTKDAQEMRQKVSGLNYDLSAALYLDVFTAAVGCYSDPFKTFIWIFASKDQNTAKPWEATQENIRVGRAKWRKAIKMMAKYKDANWVVKEETGYLSPNTWELSWISEWKVKV